MKVLLINPMLLARERYDLEYPINLIYLAAGLKESPAGISSTVLDMTFEYFRRNLTGVPVPRAQEFCVEQVWKESGPFDLVGIGGLCDNFHLTVRLAEFVKKKFKVPVVVGGPHATFISEEVLKAYPFVDFIIRHDGVYPLLKLCEALEKGELGKVPALTYREPGSGRILQTARSAASPNVSTVTPDYSLLPPAEFLKINPECRITVLAGTGCPFNCTYCSTSLMWDRCYRVFSPEKIAAQIRKLKRDLPPVRYALVHDNLLLDKAFTLRLCTALAKTGVSWGCSSRLEHIAGDLRLMRKLKASGCEGVFVGIETGSPRMQRVIRKNIDLSKVVSLSQDLSRSGLNPVFSFILGFPQETDEDRDKTVRLAVYLRVLGAERINILHLFPLPGTEVAGRGPFVPGKESSYRPPQVAPDARARRLVLENPGIFRHFWALNDGPGKTKLIPAATWDLHDLAVDHYRSLNYLFSRAGVRPSSLFPLLGRKKPERTFLKGIAALITARQYKVFRELFRYESVVARLALSRGGKHGPVSGKFSPGRKYVLSKTASLFSCGVDLPAYLSPELPRPGLIPEERVALLCLVENGKTVETFEVNKDLFSALLAMKGKGNRPLRALLSSIPGKNTQRSVLASLRKLFKLGAIVYA